MAQGKLGDAEPLFKDALAMYRRLAVTFSQDKTEGETLTLLARQPLTRDLYLSTARGHTADPAGVYAQVWADKGYIARVYERRLLQARAAASDPKAGQTLADLTDARRRRAELLLVSASKDPATLAQRQQDIVTYEVRIEEKTRELKVLLPASAARTSSPRQFPPSFRRLCRLMSRWWIFCASSTSSTTRTSPASPASPARPGRSVTWRSW